jgi:hypothetical protein
MMDVFCLTTDKNKAVVKQKNKKIGLECLVISAYLRLFVMVFPSEVTV